MEIGWMMKVVILKALLGPVFVAWIWTLQRRSRRQTSPGRRASLLLWAMICCTLGVAAEFYYFHAQISSALLPRLLLLSSFSLGCLGMILALLGKGSGRLLTTIASCELAITWIPFLLA